jgi:YbbR domain-containing protein
VQVSFALPQKELPVEVVFKNNDEHVETLIVEPSTVMVTGPSPFLKDLSSILTEEIDLKTKEDNFIEEIPLILPEGITCNYDRAVVQVYLVENADN